MFEHAVDAFGLVKVRAVFYVYDQPFTGWSKTKAQVELAHLPVDRFEGGS